MASSAALQALWFDGRRSQARPVLVHVLPGERRRPRLRLHMPEATADAGVLELSHDQVDWPSASGRRQRRLMVDLHEHGSLEVDAQSWQQALEAAGARMGLAQTLQTRWPVFLAMLLATVLVLAGLYRWGTPWAANQLARHVPLAIEQQLSADAMEALDHSQFKPSQLPPERQAALRTQFEALARQAGTAMRPDPAYAPTITLQFRAGMGPNAFALPGGTLVMTDAMVELAQKEGLGDEALMGVLAHEVGHVLYRHGTRRVIELGVLNIGLGLALGDVSSIVSFGSTLVAGLAYSRAHETEADCFALALMRHEGRPLAPMADLLLAADRKLNGGKPGEQGPRTVDWFSTHPDAEARAHAIQPGQMRGCAAP